MWVNHTLWSITFAVFVRFRNIKQIICVNFVNCIIIFTLQKYMMSNEPLQGINAN